MAAAERDAEADGEEKVVERLCERCGSPYVEEFNVGEWRCGAHPEGALLRLVHAQDAWPRFSCCRATDAPLVTSTWDGVPLAAYSPPEDAPHIYRGGCTRVDHDVDMPAPGEPRVAVPVRAWSRSRLARLREAAVVRAPPGAVAAALGVPAPLGSPEARAAFWTLALWDPEFYEFAATQHRVTLPWLVALFQSPASPVPGLDTWPVAHRVDPERWIVAVRQAFSTPRRRPDDWVVPPAVAARDPVADGLVVAVWRQDTGPTLAVRAWADRIWETTYPTRPAGPRAFILMDC